MKKINYYLILTITFLLPSYLVRFSIFGIPTTILEILIYLSVIFTVIYYLKYQSLIKKQKKYNNLLIPIFLFIVAGIIGVFVSPEKTTALGQFKAYILDPILFFWVLTKNIKTKKQISQILYALIFSGIYVSLHAMWQYFTGQTTFDFRVVGIFGYTPNYLAFYMVPITIIAIYKFNYDKTKNILANFLKVITVCSFVFIIYLTKSRAAYLALVGAPSLSLFIKWIFNLKIKKYIKFTVLIFSILGVLIVLWQFLAPNFELSAEEGARVTASNNVRWQIWETSTKDILFEKYNWIIGIGLGNYQNYFSNLTSDWVNYPEFISPKALTAHNLFLHTWISIGLLGIISLIWIIILFFKKIKFKDFLSYLIFISMISIIIQGLVDTPYWKNDLSVMFWILIFIVSFIKSR